MKGSHLRYKIANKHLNVQKRVEWHRGINIVLCLPLLFCESSMSEKENPDRKNINYYRVFTLTSFMFEVIFL